MDNDSLIPIGGIYCKVSPSFQRGVYENSLCCLKANTHDDGVVLMVNVKEAAKTGYAECRGGRDSVNFAMPGSKTRRGRVGVDMANTLDTSCNQGIFVRISEELTVYAVWYPKKQCYIAIRRLTPRECFRLQGWDDRDFEKAQLVNSDTQLYKQAGNGVTVTVVEAIANRFGKEEVDADSQD